MIEDILDAINPIMIKLVGALLILFIGFIVGRLLGLFIKRVLNGVNLDRNIKKSIGYKLSAEALISSTLSILVYAAAIIMALNYLGLTTVVLTIITTAVIIILVVSFLLAIRDLLPNAFAGITIKYRKDFKEGDEVTVRKVKGKVEELSLMTTRVKAGKDIIILPNALFQREGYTVKRKKR